LIFNKDAEAVEKELASGIYWKDIL
jgi:hypothetical protein